MMKFHTIIIVFLIFISCKNQPEVKPDSSKQKTMGAKYTTCQLIEKEFIGKGGKTGRQELYLRCSIQDYYIKICEGNVAVKELRPFLNKGINVDMEIKEGEWDVCEGKENVQSRIGFYVVINKVIK